MSFDEIQRATNGLSLSEWIRFLSDFELCPAVVTREEGQLLFQAWVFIPSSPFIAVKFFYIECL